MLTLVGQVLKEVTILNEEAMLYLLFIVFENLPHLMLPHLILPHTMLPHSMLPHSMLPVSHFLRCYLKCRSGCCLSVKIRDIRFLTTTQMQKKLFVNQVNLVIRS